MRGLKQQREDFRERENKGSRLIIETDGAEWHSLTNRRGLANEVSGEVNTCNHFSLGYNLCGWVI